MKAVTGSDWEKLCCSSKRFGELLERDNLTPQQIKFEPGITAPKFMKVHIKSTKTNPFEGRKVYFGKGDTWVYPTFLIRNYLKKYKRLNDNSTFFVFENGSILTYEKGKKILRILLKKIGLNPKEFAGHSFRRGLAQTAADADFSDSEIKILGGWAGDSSKLYYEHKLKQSRLNERLERGRSVKRVFEEQKQESREAMSVQTNEGKEKIQKMPGMARVKREKKAEKAKKPGKSKKVVKKSKKLKQSEKVVEKAKTCEKKRKDMEQNDKKEEPRAQRYNLRPRKKRKTPAKFRK